MPDNFNPGRRKVLKTVGGLTVGSSVVSTATATKGSSAGAEKSLNKKFENSLKLRRKKDLSVEEWHDHLETIGVPYGAGQIGDFGGGMSSSDVSTQAIALLEEPDLTLTMTYYSLDGYDGVDLNWNFSDGVDDTNTGAPPDIASIGWPQGHYSKPSEKDGNSMVNTGSSYTTLPDDQDGITSTGCVVTWEGPSAQCCSGDDSDYHDWFTTYVEPNTSYADYQRELYFDFVMTWHDTELTGVSASTGGVSFSVSSTAESWRVECAYDENDLYGGEQFSES